MRSKSWRVWQELNLRPLASEASTLSTELQTRNECPHALSRAQSAFERPAILARSEVGRAARKGAVMEMLPACQ